MLRTPLHVAAGSYSCARQLLTYGAALHTPDLEGRLPLHLGTVNKLLIIIIIISFGRWFIVVSAIYALYIFTEFLKP